MLAGLDDIPDDKLEAVAFEQMIAAVALYRPGPMDYIPEYIEASRNSAAIHYDCPEEEEILAPTFGVIVYQEQVMQLVQRLAGYSMGRADVVRKAMGKKKAEIMAVEREVFIHGNRTAYDAGKDPKYAPGCVANGIPEKVAVEIWDKMEKFASYAFNRSHAACYAYIGYLTAYMRCHWSKEFYAGMLNAFLGNSDKIKSYLAQAHDCGIQLQLPDIQQSVSQYTANQEGILCGLQGISGVKAIAEPIVRSRAQKGPYKDLEDLYTRVCEQGGTLNKTAMEGLTYSGALRSFSTNKAALLAQFPIIAKGYKKDISRRLDGQCSLFGESQRAELPDVEPFNRDFELRKEAAALGMFVSEHPAELYEQPMNRAKGYTAIKDIRVPAKKNTVVKTMGLITGLKEFMTKKGERMAAFSLETKYNAISCVIFPDAYQKVGGILRENEVYCVSGTVGLDKKDDTKLQFTVQEAVPAGEALDKYRGIVVEVSNKAEQTAVLDYVKANPGDCRVILKAYGQYFTIKEDLDEAKQSEFAQKFRICA